MSIELIDRSIVKGFKSFCEVVRVNSSQLIGTNVVAVVVHRSSNGQVSLQYRWQRNQEDKSDAIDTIG